MQNKAMRHLVTVNTIEEIKPIENAEFIESARVKGWWVVVKKNEFKIGDKVLYYEVDSFLPDIDIYSFLRKGSTLKRMLVNGEIKMGIRLKTVKLRGTLSQGLIMPLSILPAGDYEIGQDVSEILDVIKFEPPIPASLAGTVKGLFPGFLQKTDEERIQNMLPALETEIEKFYITEKIDGASVTFYKHDGVFGVCSRNLELKEDSENSLWKWARENDIENKIIDGFALQGEIVGEGIQNNPLKIKGHKVYLFNIYDIKNGRYLDFKDFIKTIELIEQFESVPVISENINIPRSLEELLKLAEGKSLLNENVEREGIVIRPVKEEKYRNGRFSFKVISNNYLLNNEQ